MSSEVSLRPATVADAPACAAILQRWMDGEDWMPDLHDLDETTAWMESTLFAGCEVTLAEIGGEVCGYIACDGAQVASLAVAEGRRGEGIGGRLLNHAKAARPAGLRLRTFAANTAALRFYVRHGFAELRRTAGENEEGLPDILLGWPADA
jgi:ribosomal protein S18 acetylase RimI-like enzyme